MEMGGLKKFNNCAGQMVEMYNLVNVKTYIFQRVYVATYQNGQRQPVTKTLQRIKYGQSGIYQKRQVDEVKTL